MANHSRPIVLSSGDRRELQRLQRSSSIPSGLSRRARAVYVRPIETRFGVRAPRVANVIAALSQMWGETIVPCGGAAANCLRLTTQNPVRTVYLTSGPNRRLRFGKSKHRRVASRSTLATSGAAPQGRRRHPRSGMARSRRG